MNKKSILKSAVGILMLISLVMINTVDVVFAGDSTSADSAYNEQGAGDLPDWDPTKVTAPSMEKFEVSTYLKLDDAQSYLENDAKKGNAVAKFIVDLIVLLTKIIGSFALLVIIAGGITIMISTGNQNLQTKGKEMIKFAIMGLVVAFMSLIIVSFVQSLFFTY